MKILWLINITLPQASSYLNSKKNNSGGWLKYLSEEIPQKNKLVILFPYSENNKFNINSVSYYGCITGDTQKYIPLMVKHFNEIIELEKPDVIHIWGTEHLHSYAMVCAAERNNIINKVCVSIQGLVSIVAKHFMAGLSWREQLCFSLRDLLRKDTLNNKQKNLIYRGLYEKKTIQKVTHIIGRTTWDLFCSMQYNPKAIYHKNNEILRDVFYERKWSINTCNRFTIFVSQAQIPIKGFHFMLEALQILKQKYPTVKLYVAGAMNPLNHNMKAMGYARLLYRIAKEADILDSVVYLGILNEEEMCKQYLASHVFVSPSSIENSPNSVGEAMLLGVPVVSSNVGGVSDLLADKKEGFLYQYDAPYMLAGYIDRIFSDDDLARSFSIAARSRAENTHNREINLKDLLDIYSDICM